VVPSGQPIDHSINQIINLTTTFGQVKSETGVLLPSHFQSTLMVMFTIPLQKMDPYTPQNLVGTPSHQEMKKHTTQQNPTVGQVPTGGEPLFSGKIPTRGEPSFNTQILTGGELPFTSQILVSTQQMIGGNPNLNLLETCHNPGDHPREDFFINHIREDHQTPTHKEEYKIQILLD
jgi:hypothetical protein